MLPVIPPLTAIEMFDKIAPPMLNCPQTIAAETSSVGPLTVLQFTTSVLAEAKPLIIKEAKHNVPNRSMSLLGCRTGTYIALYHDYCYVRLARQKQSW